jgi:DNA-binding PadR family transcriptional regulator
MVTARTAVLQALRRGPAYGRLLMRRVKAATSGRASLAPGSVYPILRALEQSGLVRKWTVVAGRVRGGRSRTYCELTVAGVREAESEARALQAFLAGGDAREIPPAERAAMRERIHRASDLFDFAIEARNALARAKRRA